jgi:hypothetical protein
VIIALLQGSARSFAGMAELVDARDSKSRDCEVMGVRFPLPAPEDSLKKSRDDADQWLNIKQRTPGASTHRR